MNIIYSTNNSDYQPLSFGSNYLYYSYDQAQTFLSNKLGKEELRRLTKPVKQDDTVFNWYANFENDVEFQPLSNFDESIRNRVIESAKEFSKKTNQIVNDLKNNNTTETLEWANLLDNIFNDNHCEIISNGTDWALIWGWKTREKNNLIPPIFIEDSNPDENNSVISTTEDTDDDNVIKPDDEPIILNEPEETLLEDDLNTNPITETNNTTSKRSFWHRLKRFFQWLTYRYWGLMLLIIYTLIIICLAKKCCKTEDKYKNIDKELYKIEKRLQERCGDELITE